MAKVNPQLADAAGSGLVGVGYWMGHRDGWHIAPADADPIGVIFPVPPTSKCFAFRDDDMGELLMFVEDHKAAIMAYEFYIDDLDGWKGAMCSISEVSPWLLTGPQITLREEMEQGLEGVAELGDDGFWHITPFAEFQ
jgi:hypothetical protein